MPKPKTKTKPKLTAEDVLFWLGSEARLEEAAEVIADVANGDYEPSLLREEIEDIQ
jgi:hypothetical protein